MNIRPLMGLGVLIALALLVGPALSHDHNRPMLDNWFKGLRSNAGAACCDGSDSMRLDDIDWETRDGHYRVRLEGEWVDVPDGAVVDEANRAGPTMVWPFYVDGKLRGVRCFMPGAMT